MHLGNFNSWEIDGRPFLQHALCYAACQSGDFDSLCIARSVCSHGIFTRSNSPEEWQRYSTILEKLGDDVAAQNARNASISLGSGEGGHFGDNN